VTLGVLVSFHEFGHFIAARICGVRVLRFAVGFGKPLYTFHAKNKTEWVLAAIPLGGYVKLLDGRDREQVIAPQEQAYAFDGKKLWQRSFIVAAGPLANFLLSIILFAVIYIPKMTNELLDKMKLRSVWARASYNPKSANEKHIIICGDLSSTSLQEFFGELFHEDHENIDLMLEEVYFIKRLLNINAVL
jgi:RIP metalloprotease RseP